MARNNRVGTQAELDAAHELEQDGWTCGSRRHIPGPGDLLAVRVRSGRPTLLRLVVEHNVQLIEVKATQGPWDHFGPEDRAALIALAEELGAEPLLAWRKPGQKAIEWLGVNDFPGVQEMAA